MRIELTNAAEQDIIELYLYGLIEFGEQQADAYEAMIRHVLDLIAGNPAIANERPEYSPPVRVHYTGKHCIVYRIVDDYVLVLRIAWRGGYCPSSVVYFMLFRLLVLLRPEAQWLFNIAKRPVL